MVRKIQSMLEKTRDFIKKANGIHNFKYDYSMVDYKNTLTLVDIICDKHGLFHQIPKSHLKGHGCKKCNNCEVDLDNFIARARKKHGEKYDYSLTKYTGSHDSILIICPIHGQQTIIASNHLRKHGCPACGLDYKNQNNKTKPNVFLQKSHEIHGNRFDYSKTLYKSAREKVVITCREHGDFEQEPRSHLSGNGCPYCSGLIRNKKRFLEKAWEVHGEKYTYENTDYKNSKSKITVTCLQHGDFNIIAGEFLRGSGCRGCMSSHPETVWLNSLNIPIRQFKINIGKKFIIVDGYDPRTNTCYEFHGDFWHGNPSVYPPTEINRKNGMSFGELYNKTLEKEKTIRELGFNLVCIWEDAWKKFNS